MATALTPNLGLTTVETNDVLTEAVVNANFDILDQYVAAVALTNRSGGSVAAGTVVVVDTANDSSFTTTTTANDSQVIGVAQATINNAAAGIVKQHGASLVRVDAATARGNWLVTSTLAGQASPISAANPPNGTFAIALTSTGGSGTVTAMLLITAVTSTISLPASTSPTPTTEGVAEWDSNDDRIVVGNGTDQSIFYPGQSLWGGTQTSIFPTGRYLVAYFGGGISASAIAPVGVGFSVAVGSSGALTAVAGSRSSFDVLAASRQAGVYSSAAAMTPARSPLLAIRATPKQTNANLVVWQMGFSSDPNSATAFGAYFLRTTTGNVFAVTRQAAATTTDLGALNDTTLREWRVYTNDAGVTWVFEINGSVVATHTTNVPTASTNLFYGANVGASGAGGAGNDFEVERMLVLANTP